MNGRPGGRIALDPEGPSVGAARRWVVAQLSTCPEPVVEAAELLVSELATNAVIHARTPFELRVEHLGERVRVEVADRSTTLPAQRHYATDATTGRGLKLVEALSTAWGIQLGAGGKVVYFELALSPGQSGAGPLPVVTAALDLDDWPELEEAVPEPPATDEALVPIRILGLPLAHMHRSSEQYDALIREFRLILDQDPDVGEAVPGRLLSLVEELTERYGAFTGGMSEAIDAAYERGDATMDLEYRLPAAVGPAAARYDALLDEADAYCRAGKELLTLAPSAETVAFRKWFLLEFVRQTTGGAPLAWSDSPWADQSA